MIGVVYYKAKKPFIHRQGVRAPKDLGDFVGILTTMPEVLFFERKFPLAVPNRQGAPLLGR